MLFNYFTFMHMRYVSYDFFTQFVLFFFTIAPDHKAKPSEVTNNS